MKTPIIDPIEDALIYLEDEAYGRHSDPWTTAEMRELKRASARIGFGEDLYRAMVANRNGWSHRGGLADINQIESWQNEYLPN